MITLFLLSSFVNAHRRHHKSHETTIREEADAEAARVNAERHKLANSERRAYKKKKHQFKAAREGWRGEPQQEQR